MNVVFFSYLAFSINFLLVPHIPDGFQLNFTSQNGFGVHKYFSSYIVFCLKPFLMTFLFNHQNNFNQKVKSTEIFPQTFKGQWDLLDVILNIFLLILEGKYHFVPLIQIKVKYYIIIFILYLKCICTYVSNFPKW